MSSEKFLYYGPASALADDIRRESLAEQMNTGPTGWMAGVAKALLGLERSDKTRAPQVEAFARDILRGLGFNPERCSLSRKRTGGWAGLQVRGSDGTPLKFISDRELRRLLAKARRRQEHAGRGAGRPGPSGG